jgi:myosin heavy subunit
MKDMKALLLVLLSAGLLGTWVYHLYDKNHYRNLKSESILIKDTAAVQSRVKDSLQVLFNQAMEQMIAKRSDVDSLKDQLDTQVFQIFKLRNEISNILKNRNLTKADLTLAKEKIAELQKKIQEVKDQNDNLEEERVKLSTTLNQLSAEMKDLHENIQRLGKENKELAETINQASTFIVSEMRLIPVDVRQGTKETETSQAFKANKFLVSFAVQNNIVKNTMSEVVVVITDPGGKVLHNDIWESGIFETKTSGTKDYTIKLRFEYNRGEQKRMMLTLEPEKFIKGNYKMQVYHNGVLIGETSKTLS